LQLNSKTNTPFVTVIVCTYNRKNLLKDCLNSIYAMDYPKSQYEVLIVDKGSTDGTEDLCKMFPQIRFVTKMRFGVPYQRNRGADLAKGVIVAYTDDDCMVDKHWLKNLIDGFRISESIVAVGGPVYPFNPNAIPKKIRVNAVFGLFDEGEKIKLTSAIITANSAFKKDIFRTIRFDEKLGRTSSTRYRRFVLKGEDTTFCYEIINSGHKILYTPFAKVYHQIRGERIRVSYIVEHAINGGLAQTRFYLKEKRSRIWAIRCSLSLLIQILLKVPFDASVVSCYNLIYGISTFIISSAGLDKILIRGPHSCVSQKK
jgi:glycosyltransferase involved in cell wall biosynthesis